MAYAGSQAQVGRGSKMSIGEVPTPIGEVSDIPFKRPEFDFVDVTNLDSDLDQEVKPTIRKSVTFTVKGNRVPSDAGQTAVETAYQDATISSFVIELPKSDAQAVKGDTYSFKAYVLNSDFDVSPTKQIEFSITLKTSGQIAYAAGS